MNILYIVGSDPRQVAYGGQQRVHFVWEALKKLGSVYTVYPVTHKWMETRDEVDHVYSVQIDRRYSPSWILRRLMKDWSVHITLPFSATASRIWKLNLPKPDICIVRAASLASAVNVFDRCPVIVDMDDVASVEIEMLMKEGDCSVKSKLSHWWLKRMEKLVYRRAHHVWVADEAVFPLVKGVPVSFLPNIPIPPLPDFASELGDANNLFFVGALAHPPNHLALDWFLDHVWEKAKERFPEFRLEIGGAGLPEQYKQKWERFKDVQLLGRIEDLRPHYQKAMAVIAPMRVGSGTCLKVMEALRMGRPLLSTQQGLRGIRPELRNAANGILSFEDADSFIAAYGSLCKMDRLEIQRNAVSFVEQRNNQAYVDSEVSRTVCRVVGEKG